MPDLPASTTPETPTQIPSIPGSKKKRLAILLSGIGMLVFLVIALTLPFVRDRLFSVIFQKDPTDARQEQTSYGFRDRDGNEINDRQRRDQRDMSSRCGAQISCEDWGVYMSHPSIPFTAQVEYRVGNGSWVLAGTSSSQGADQPQWFTFSWSKRPPAGAETRILVFYGPSEFLLSTGEMPTCSAMVQTVVPTTATRDDSHTTQPTPTSHIEPTPTTQPESSPTPTQPVPTPTTINPTATPSPTPPGGVGGEGDEHQPTPTFTPTPTPLSDNLPAAGVTVHTMVIFSLALIVLGSGIRLMR